MDLNTQGNKIPPYLRRFDPFAVLEPDKIAGNSSRNENKDSKLDLFGSLLTVKKDADIVDVFDNLYVTPRHVTCNGSTSSYEEGFKKLFDKYEEEKVTKLIDIPGTSQNKLQNLKLYPEEDIKVLEPKYILNDDVDEDLIDELILEKSIEKIRLKEISDNNYLPNKVPINNFPSKVDDQNTNHYVSNVIGANPSIENDKKPNNYLKPTIPANPNMKSSRVIPNNKESKTSQVLAQQNTPKLTPIPENSYKCKVIIETVSKDPKVFQKRRIVKPEKEISKYTKGASLYEKSIVLPQIMDRLMKRKIADDIKKNLPRKLSLDTGVTIASKDNEPDNELTRTREIRRKKMEEFINHQQIGNLNVSLRDSPKLYPSTNKDIAGGNNDLNKSNIGATLNKTNTNEVFTTKEIQRQILLAMISKNHIKGASTSIIKGVKSDESSEIEVSLPEVLMENCNRQRLIEFKRRRLFENFVLNRKMSG